MTAGKTPETPRIAQENIRAVAGLQREILHEGGLSQRIADRIAAFAGTMLFVVLHLIWFGVWIAINSGAIRSIRPFDPFPFILLSLIVSCEAVLIATFVLIKQNSMSRADNARDHLNLQVDLLAEREVTKILQMQRMICRHLGIPEASQDQEAKDMSEEVPVEKLAGQIKKSILRE